MHDHTSYLTYDLHAHLISLCYGKALKKEGTFVYKEITSYRGFEHRFKNHLWESIVLGTFVVFSNAYVLYTQFIKLITSNDHSIKWYRAYFSTREYYVISEYK